MSTPSRYMHVSANLSSPALPRITRIVKFVVLLVSNLNQSFKLVWSTEPLMLRDEFSVKLSKFPKSVICACTSAESGIIVHMQPRRSNRNSTGDFIEIIVDPNKNQIARKTVTSVLLVLVSQWRVLNRSRGMHEEECVRGRSKLTGGHPHRSRRVRPARYIDGRKCHLDGGWSSQEIFVIPGWKRRAHYWRLALGAWRLALGAWRLALGAWRLALGAWRLIVHCTTVGIVNSQIQPKGQRIRELSECRSERNLHIAPPTTVLGLKSLPTLLVECSIIPIGHRNQLIYAVILAALLAARLPFAVKWMQARRS